MEDSVPEKVHISDFLTLTRQFEEDQTTFQIQFSNPEEVSSLVLTPILAEVCWTETPARVLMSLNYVYETHQEA